MKVAYRHKKILTRVRKEMNLQTMRLLSCSLYYDHGTIVVLFLKDNSPLKQEYKMIVLKRQLTNQYNQISF